ncbi:MAG: hypothetical protein F6K35_19810, partial [Okeania sp. SIO2H7]|nr:hypothetical protein [Okeania sp. SIO2H7]
MVSCTFTGSLATIYPVYGASFGGIFVADQTLDGIYLTQDFNGDGGANETGEVSIYFDDTNASGFTNPTGNVFTMLQSNSGFLYYGDGNTDSVYRLL